MVGLKKRLLCGLVIFLGSRVKSPHLGALGWWQRVDAPVAPGSPNLHSLLYPPWPPGQEHYTYIFKKQGLTVPKGVAAISFLSELRHFWNDVLTRKLRVRDVSRFGGSGKKEEKSFEDVRNCCHFGLSAWLTGRKEAREFLSLNGNARWARRIFKN